MRYDLDDEKNRRNQRKHGGISFELATLAFDDPNCLVFPDRVDERGEPRWHAIGALNIEVGVVLVLLVVHAYREYRDDEEIIRIISARKADTSDLRRYQEQAMD